MTYARSIDQGQRASFIQGFLACMLWSTTNEGDASLGDCHGLEDLDEFARQGLVDRCNAFITANAKDLLAATGQPGYTFSRAGHDFMLSSNGHGAGFFDRGLGQAGDRLQEAANRAPATQAYLGDDGRVHVLGLESRATRSPRP